MLKGNISHSDLEGIIKRFQQYEQQIINQNLGQPAESIDQIRARNIVTDRTGEYYNKMRKELPIERSPSNQILKLIKREKRNIENEKSKFNIT